MLTVLEFEQLVHRDLSESQILVELAAPRVGGCDLEGDPIRLPLPGPRPDALQEGVADAAVAVVGLDEHVVNGGPRLREEGGGALTKLARDEADRPAFSDGHEEERVAAVRDVGQKTAHRLLCVGGSLVYPVVGRVFFCALHPEPRRLGRVLPASPPYDEVPAHHPIVTHAPASAAAGVGY